MTTATFTVLSHKEPSSAIQSLQASVAIVGRALLYKGTHTNDDRLSHKTLVFTVLAFASVGVVIPYR